MTVAERRSEICCKDIEKIDRIITTPHCLCYIVSQVKPEVNWGSQPLPSEIFTLITDLTKIRYVILVPYM